MLLAVAVPTWYFTPLRLRLSVVSASLAPPKRSRVTLLVAASVASAVSAADTVGASLVPVIVMVAVWATVPPLPSLMV